MRKLNYCHIYLQVTHLSDITTSDGKRPHPTIPQATATRLNNQLQCLQWPIQAKPNKATWQLWTETLQFLVCGTALSLAVPLRKWTNTYK
eukprot:5857545-Ditylum_brightwellii.AAC.1